MKEPVNIAVQDIRTELNSYVDLYCPELSDAGKDQIRQAFICGAVTYHDIVTAATRLPQEKALTMIKRLRHDLDCIAGEIIRKLNIHN